MVRAPTAIRRSTHPAAACFASPRKAPQTMKLVRTYRCITLHCPPCSEATTLRTPVKISRSKSRLQSKNNRNVSGDFTAVSGGGRHRSCDGHDCRQIHTLEVPAVRTVRPPTDPLLLSVRLFSGGTTSVKTLLTAKTRGRWTTRLAIGAQASRPQFSSHTMPRSLTPIMRRNWLRTVETLRKCAVSAS